MKQTLTLLMFSLCLGIQCVYADDGAFNIPDAAPTTKASNGVLTDKPQIDAGATREAYFSYTKDHLFKGPGVQLGSPVVYAWFDNTKIQHSITCLRDWNAYGYTITSQNDNNAVVNVFCYASGFNNQAKGKSLYSLVFKINLTFSKPGCASDAKIREYFNSNSNLNKNAPAQYISSCISKAEMATMKQNNIDVSDIHALDYSNKDPEALKRDFISKKLNKFLNLIPGAKATSATQGSENQLQENYGPNDSDDDTAQFARDPSSAKKKHH